MSKENHRLWPSGNSVSWQDIVDMRGGVEPTKCDFCGEDKPPIELEPEEAGMWACIDCIERWRKEDSDARQQEAK